MEDISLKNMIEDTINDLNAIESKYYNAFKGNVFQVAIYLCMRCGEIPNGFDDTKLLKLSEYIAKQETLFNEDINDYLEDIITE